MPSVEAPRRTRTMIQLNTLPLAIAHIGRSTKLETEESFGR